MMWDDSIASIMGWICVFITIFVCKARTSLLSMELFLETIGYQSGELLTVFWKIFGVITQYYILYVY